MLTFHLVFAASVFQLAPGHVRDENQYPIVTVNTGKLRGKVTQKLLGGKEVYTFLGVPYASPPIGKKRFLPPQPLVPWEGIRSAQEFGKHCPQNTAEANQILSPLLLPHNDTSEDCLTLNIYSPGLAGKRAVLVWVHGGANKFGSGSQYDGTVLSSLHDVVVVTFNYRLGVFGFLSTLDDSMPGNAGLWDQRAALRWVQRNIGHFGGDPQQVTLAGESSGGMSVSVHVTSSASTGLFRRAISLSGSAVMLHKLYADPVEDTRLLAEKLNCVSPNIVEMVNCLRTKSARDILSVSNTLRFLYHLTIDGDMLANKPLLLYKQKYFNQVDYLVGLDNDEGYSLSSGIFGDNMENVITFSAFKNHAKTLVRMYTDESVELLTQLITDLYLGIGKDQSAEYLRQRASLLTGHMINSAPIVLTAQLHSAIVRNTFMFVFKYRASYSKRPRWVISDHGQQLPFVFGYMLSKQYPHRHNCSKEDESMSHKTMKYLTNFIKTGDPNNNDLPDWPRFSPGEHFIYLSPNVTVEQRYEEELMQFWNNRFVNLMATVAPPPHDEF